MRQFLPLVAPHRNSLRDPQQSAFSSVSLTDDEFSSKKAELLSRI